MITLFHIVYCTIRGFHTFLQRMWNSEHQNVISKLPESEVKDSENELECVMKFDPPMYCQRYSAVHEILINEKWRGQIKKIVDFGCAEFGFFVYVKRVIGLQEILFVDIDKQLLEFNSTRLFPFPVDYLCPRKEPLTLKSLSGSIAYPSAQLTDIDAVICIEIIEHLYPDTLDALPYNIFGFIQPRIAIFTTPNADFNVLFPKFSGFRHYDHKFEWTREQFEDWAKNISVRYPNYSLTLEGIGSGPKGTEKLGECSQMAVFVKQEIDLKDDVQNCWKSFFHILETDGCTDKADKENSSKDVYNACKFCKYEQISNYDFLSYGICTFETCSLSTNRDSPKSVYGEVHNGGLECAHSKFFYEELSTVEYPYEVDTRTQDEIILHNAEYCIHRLGAPYGRYFNEREDRSEIPLHELTSNQEGILVSVSDLRNVLEKSGWKTQECNVEGSVTLCVIYDPNAGMSDSSRKTRSTDNSENNYFPPSNWENEEPWDSEVPESDRTDITTAPPPSLENVSLKSAETSAVDKKLNLATEGPSSERQHSHLECLFNSGCQVSTSSIELSPELFCDISIDRPDTNLETIRVRSEPESLKSYKNMQLKPTSNKAVVLPVVMKSDGNIIRPQKNMRNVCIPEMNLAAEPILEPPENQEIVIENGDLANNNRDGEGNNYQALENENLNENDNAVPRVANLDEDNENHIIVVENEEPPELEEDNLEGVSREVLYDPNSDNSLSEVDFVEISPFPEYSDPFIISRMPVHAISLESVRDPNIFPGWLLHLLNMSEVESNDVIVTEPHFYSQGDGLGIHPSVTDISTDSSSSDDTTHLSASTVVEQGPSNAIGPVESQSESEDYYSLDNINHSGLLERIASNLDDMLMEDAQEELLDEQHQSTSTQK